MTQTITPEIILPTTDILQVTPNEAALIKMRTEYAALVIKDENDRIGRAAVATARLDCKNARVTIETARKTLKEPLLERGKQIDNEAKRLTGIILPTEERLIAEQTKDADREAARLKEEERKRLEAIELERQRKIKEENERLAAERAKLEEERKAQAAEMEAFKAAQAKQAELIAAERKRVADEQKAMQDKLDAQQNLIDEANAKAAAETKRLTDIETARIAAEDKRAADAAKQLKQSTNPEPKQLRDFGSIVPARAFFANRQVKILAPNRNETSVAEITERQVLLTVAACVRGIDVPDVESNKALDCAVQITVIIDRAAAGIEALINEILPVSEVDDEIFPF